MKIKTPGFYISLSLAACTPLQPLHAPAQRIDNSYSHITSARFQKHKPTIPPIVTTSHYIQKNQTIKEHDTYSVLVQNVEIKELLFALARDAKLNVDIHNGIEGTLTLSANKQTIHQILERIAKQADIRIEYEKDYITITPDSPYLRTYKVDYVNINRDATGTVALTTQVSSAVPGNSSSLPGSSSNNSVTRIESSSKNHFWETLLQNLRDLLRETDKILPDGSSEEVEEVSGNVQTSGTGRSHGGTGNSRTPNSTLINNTNPQPTTAAATLASSPQAAELQNRGTRVLRRSTFREAASVIANPETGILSIRATSKQHEKIQTHLESVLDSARRQVLIEATVAEVRLDQNHQQGIDWAALPFGRTGFSISQSMATGTALTQANSAKFVAGYSNSSSSVGDLRASIRLLESFGNVRVLSSPKISVLNNQTAVLKVVDNEVYFTMKADTTTSANVGTQTTYTTTVNSVPVGFVMNVTPQISNNDNIVLNVRPSISRKIGTVADPNPTLAAANVQSLIPVIRTREMESLMRVENGKVAVMGGLMEESSNQQLSGLPGSTGSLSPLFSSRDSNEVRTELVIFLRPTIIKNPSLDGDYQSFRFALPDSHFFAPRPVNKGARTSPEAP